MYKSIRFKALVILLSFVVLYGLTTVLNFFYNSEKDKIYEFNNNVKNVQVLLLLDAIAVNNFFIMETDNEMFFHTENSYYIEEHNIYMSAITSKINLMLSTSSIDKFGVRQRFKYVNSELMLYNASFNKIIQTIKHSHHKTDNATENKSVISLKEQLDEQKKTLLNNISDISEKVNKQRNDLFGELRYIFEFTIFVIIIIGICFSIFLSKQTTKRLIKLSSVIAKFVDSKFTDTEDYKFKIYKDEIGDLTNNYTILKTEVWNQINHLEENVEKRTRQIACQNKQIKEQNEEISAQRDEVIEKNQLIEKQKNNTLDSIRYAKKIQEAFLPKREKITKIFSENFIIWQPKALVSGDFYWFKHLKQKDISIWAVADCTGHGVPGGFMSMLGNALLNEIILRKKYYNNAATILNLLRKRLIANLQVDETTDRMNDGMDIALIIYENKSRKIQFAGANRPLIIIRNNEIIQIKGDKMPIGKHVKTENTFTNHAIEVQDNDAFYTFSDGYVDQFCSNNKHKFLSRNFKNLLLANHTKPMSEQADIYLRTHEEWKGTTEQTDDILLVGFRPPIAK